MKRRSGPRAKVGRRILHCEVRSDKQGLELGHWFFHEGQWAICGQAGRTDKGLWYLDIHFERAGRKLELPTTFRTLRDVTGFLADYFETDVVRVRGSQMPKPEEL